MNRIFTHLAVDSDGWTVRKFLSLREARHFCERNDLKVVATGEKAHHSDEIYINTALLECGECTYFRSILWKVLKSI